MTLSHPHGQIYAYPYLPPRVEKILASVRRHREATGGDLFAEVVAAERSGPRVVTANEHWTAFVPAATALALRGAAVPDPAGAGHPLAHRRGAGRLRRRLPRRPGPVRPPHGHAHAVHRVLEPGPGARPGARTGGCTCSCSRFRRAPGKLKYLAGSESGMGAFITDTNPEDVAEQLRAVVVRVTADHDAARRAEEAFAEHVRRPARGRLGGPGRVNVIGEHTDYNGGFVLPDRAGPHHPRGGRPAGRRPARRRLAPGRRRGRGARPRRPRAGSARRAGPATRPASSPGCATGCPAA